ncbi:MAG: arginine--tRNA ligase [Sulfuricurvum sp. GWF2_44_89]|uniref:Arginine--tRNA ligase n=1 Tax=Sulfuricurvum kujiense TaxID=148813 RepID=A0A2D3WDW2_9BACT|nr:MULTISPECIES: arginine--tRNA ligase [Sulfuricurvum]OHD77788.1 MAG: arginine--tRNA ligase [Sulfuricurvum sp. GWF2_44_89]OHD96712.1 MAG: arginine--tRNA ligase [Sulfuricurvum sp. RIFOXYD12_FULL_44_77]OHD99899.1 MAG: arginine--tRNA ligase [Sulfuricurvum sp. RIFOXYD2_FULL_44_160]DAB38618.1 MAG TPA: arginine--tRNA ligase [Sulfuricurvum kujiense]
MKQRVNALLRDRFNSDVILEKPKDRSFGHFATPIAFSLAKELRKSPMIIAEEIAGSFSDESMFSAVESVQGYINFRLSEGFLDEYASWALRHGEQFGSSDKKGSILLEFVSANPTGPLHIGHARGAVYGDTILRLGRHLGYDITAEYYVNDAGNQIDLLGVSLQLEGRSSLLGESVEWPEKYYRGEYLSDLAKEVVELFGEEALRDESRQKELALWAKDKILALIVDDLGAINVHFDTFVGEASLYSEWDRVMAKMGEGVYVSEGKTFIRSSEHGDDHDRVVVREDGRPTYLAGDIIYHNQKFERGYEDYINIWGADHHGYIARVKAAVNFLGYDSEKLEVLLSQMVSLLKDGEPFKMSKRAGTVILMSDVVEEIGAEALRFMFASKKCDTALEFDIEELKRQDSSNPIYYIQYAHARIQTLLAKSEKSMDEIMGSRLHALSADADGLLFEALLLPEIIDDAFESRQAQKLPDYLKVLAGRLHKFYYDTRIIGSEDEAKLLKLLLVVALSIKTGLSLLGIQAKDRM